MTDAPRLWLNGRRLDTTAGADVLVLAPAVITWGASSGEDQPDAATLTVTLLFPDGTTMADLPDLQRGAEIELTHVDTGTIVFAGTVSTMTAKPSTLKRGGLEVTVSAADYLAQLDSEYAAVDWSAGTNRVNQLRSVFADAGWEIRVPDDARESAAAVLDSVKIDTMLQRYISRFDGRRYDTSYRQVGTLDLHRRVSAFAAAERSAPADQLDATEAGWDAQQMPPIFEGAPAPVVEISAANILADPSWTSGPEDVVTAVKLSTMRLGDNGRSELVEHNFRAPAATRQRLGLRSISRDSDLATPADWQPAAAAYFTDDAPWRTSAITIKDSDLLPLDALTALLAVSQRYQALVVVTGILINRPDPGPRHLRAYIVGGEYEWDGKRWNITLTLDRPILHLDGDGDWWTCQRVADSPNYLITSATCATVGDSLTVADFRYIGAP